MKYELPNGEVIDLGIYTLEDCIPLNDIANQKELAEVLFNQTGIIVAGMEGGEKYGRC